MKYLVMKDWSWKDFAATAGTTLDAAELTTGDGKPLPKAVVDVLIARKAIAPADDPAAPDAAPPAAGPAVEVRKFRKGDDGKPVPVPVPADPAAPGG